MNDTPRENPLTGLFSRNLPAVMTLGGDGAEALLLREYGSVFVARGGVVPPDRVKFNNSSEVEAFQNKVSIRTETIGGFEMTLQAEAMNALMSAMKDAKANDLSINPRGADSAKRSYDGTVGLWASRVEPALDHWTRNGRINRETAAAIRRLPPSEQVSEVLILETEGIWFAKDLSKSIIYSVAPPGTSQHLSMLAFDVKEFADPAVRAILSARGWHRTVASDLPHFTFLGVTEAELPALGLKQVTTPDGDFWLPDI
jgi:hypothetical protein